MTETRALLDNVTAIHIDGLWGCVLEDETDGVPTEFSFFFDREGNIIRTKLIDGTTTYDFYEKENGIFHAFIGDSAQRNDPKNVEFEGRKDNAEQMKRLRYLPLAHLSDVTRAILMSKRPKGTESGKIRKKCQPLVAELLKNPPHPYPPGSNWFVPFHRVNKETMKGALKVFIGSKARA
ncbi:hypothetical protein FOL47_007598 [Perkinsus chesapeaki]|uniref:Uncharacterized protein n=1 Tax=Perkinsus chesapeaki TaxID=330153 RepID=A0A7J6LJC5_PERCH|nr:hypothetical protein FOL47_007598 [Perkinsus chesapeaki]